MNMDKAAARLNEETKRQMAKFCPLSKDRCRADCECFVDGWISDNEEYAGDSPIEYQVHGPYCNCVALKGN